MSDDLEIVPKKALHKMLEMADRIDQLEAALQKIASFKASFAQEWAADALEIARAALGEKKND